MENQSIVFITGASSGIGQACAELFARHGAKLILCARRESRLQELSKSLKEKYNTNSLCLTLDVTSQQAVFNTIENLTPDWQKIDILINNAGLAAGADKFQDADITDWEAMIDTNIKGLLYVSKAIIPNMIKQQSGHVINIGSIAGHQTYIGGSVYCGSKAAVKSITEGLKLDLTGTGVRVTAVDPGMVETEFSEVRFKQDKDKADAVYQNMTPLSPMDIAETVYFCASRPKHVNICDIIIFPTDQSSTTVVHRG